MKQVHHLPQYWKPLSTLFVTASLLCGVQNASALPWDEYVHCVTTYRVLNRPPAANETIVALKIVRACVPTVPAPSPRNETGRPGPSPDTNVEDPADVPCGEVNKKIMAYREASEKAGQRIKDLRVSIGFSKDALADTRKALTGLQRQSFSDASLCMESEVAYDRKLNTSKNVCRTTRADLREACLARQQNLPALAAPKAKKDADCAKADKSHAESESVSKISTDLAAEIDALYSALFEAQRDQSKAIVNMNRYLNEAHRCPAP